MSSKANGTNREKRLPIMEIFGPTVQGEGLMGGTITHFLRTGGCGLKCAWCDTMFAVDPKQVRAGRKMMTSAEILDELGKKPYAPYLTLTGGDPCLHKTLGDIIPAVNAVGTRVAVETQGTEFPGWLSDCDVVTFSPKPPSSKNAVDPDDFIAWIHDQTDHGRRKMKICVKIVIFTQEDFEYALRVFSLMPIWLYDAFYFTAGTQVMVDQKFEDLDQDQLIEYGIQKTTSVIINFKQLANTVLEAAYTTNFNEKVHVGCQQHVLIWPDKDKGV